MRSAVIETYKRTLTLTPRQREILVGVLLGDGHLETQDSGRTYRLKIEHSITQRAYVDWLYEEFRAWVRTPPQERQRFVRLRTVSGVYRTYWFSTLSGGPLRFYAQQFYRARRKAVPPMIRRLLTPLALAVWYMDDGSVKSKAHRTVLFNTHGFRHRDLVVLQRALSDAFGIATTLRAQREGTQVYCTAATIDTLRELIEPHMHPSMRRKLPITWNTLPKR